jgi:hypothetical protein
MFHHIGITYQQVRMLTLLQNRHQQLFCIKKRKTSAKGFYKSNESKEHAKKSRILMGSGPQRICEACRIEFTQSTPMGKAKYCSIPCRDNYYSQERKKLTTPWYLRERNLDGTFKEIGSEK